MSRSQIAENLRLFEEEQKQRMANPIYRIRFEFYKFKRWVRTWM
jgi:hypothetical protein